MKNKKNIKTVRLSARETELTDRFLASNPAIEGFSALARIAILDLIAKRGSIPLKPIVEETKAKRPSFLWDYDLGEGQIREILAGPLEKRKWLVGRILERATLDEALTYLTPRDIERDLPHVRIPATTREHWEFALKRWRYTA